MDLGGFHQVLLTRHTPLVWDLADRILTIGGGSAVVGDREVTTPEFPSLELPLVTSFEA
jgi:hypothetical protein